MRQFTVHDPENRSCLFAFLWKPVRRLILALKMQPTFWVSHLQERAMPAIKRLAGMARSCKPQLLFRMI